MRNRHRFRLSDMMPSAWFYRLKDTNRRTSSTAANQTSNNNNIKKTNSPYLASSTMTHQHHPTGASLPLDLNPRKSYHFPRDLSPGLPDPPRRPSRQQARPSSRKSSKPKQAVASSPPLKPVSFSSASLSCRASSDSVWTRTEDADSPDSIFDSGSSPEFRLDRVLTPESDIIIYVDENSYVGKPRRATGNRNLDAEPNFDLPRIVTKPAKPRRACNVDHVEAEEGETKKFARKVREINGGSGGSRKGASRRRSLTSSSPRLRLKIKSPRLASRRPAAQARRRGGVSSGSSGPSDPGRRKLSGSFAVVKSSLDPERDFRESMVEMIVEHNIKTTKDLEELLACYLSLNSEEYYELIIEVFKQIWFDLTRH